MENDDNIDPLLEHPTVAQKKNHTEAVTRKYKALTVIHSAVTEELLAKLMTCETAREA